MSEQDDKGKSERVQRAYSTNNMIEQPKRRSGVARRRPGESEDDFKKRVGRGPYQRDAAHAPTQESNKSGCAAGAQANKLILPAGSPSRRLKTRV